MSDVAFTPAVKAIQAAPGLTWVGRGAWAGWPQVGVPAGNLLAAGGQTGFNESWNQQFDLTFTDNAPYLDLSTDIGDFNLDGSIREEFFSGTGWAQGSSGNPIGTASVVQTDPRTLTAAQPS